MPIFTSPIRNAISLWICSIRSSVSACLSRMSPSSTGTPLNFMMPRYTDVGDSTCSAIHLCFGRYLSNQLLKMWKSLRAKSASAQL